ncbi:hypothetical protein LWI29_000174 [Acer saccharum]|uniref:Uncharacterized protein n=1 Tax=Acer saccharum TaxID=4024 RepID=A0AA39TPL0_ACESA|nr:hypothetical protein LWI29_000174 [Acer saccharum]
MSKFVRCELIRISRDHNSQADALAKLASTSDMKLPRTITIFRLSTPSIPEDHPINVLIPDPVGESWMTPIMDYLRHGTLPEDKIAAQRIRRQAPRYLIINGSLFRRGFSLPYLRCVSPPQTEQILQEWSKKDSESGARKSPKVEQESLRKWSTKVSESGARKTPKVEHESLRKWSKKVSESGARKSPKVEQERLRQRSTKVSESGARNTPKVEHETKPMFYVAFGQLTDENVATKTLLLLVAAMAKVAGNRGKVDDGGCNHKMGFGLGLAAWVAGGFWMDRAIPQ